MNLQAKQMTAHVINNQSHDSLAERGLLKRIVSFREIGIFGAVIVLFIALTLINQDGDVNKFTRTENLLTIARQISMVTLLAVGMTFIIVGGDIDLSVGSVFATTGIVLGTLIKQVHMNPWLALICALLLGLLIGLLNGLVVTKLGVPAFIVTLGGLSTYRGIALGIAGGYPVTSLPVSRFYDITAGYLVIQTGRYLSIPMQVIWMLTVLAIGFVVLSKTRFGYHVYATGSNRLAATLAGIPTDRVRLFAFMLMGFLVALGSGLQLGFLKSFAPTAGSNLELRVIAAVIIGGTNLFGGSGNVLGTFLGATVVGMINNGLILAGVPTYWQFFAIGLIIIGAVVLDMQIRRRQK
ncbi:MAG: ABC transporter permease [Anaerolineales bacterium]|nr:ABC transporter permease [Anaerolineales bacterium]HJN42178.1 ABC transporter permease [Anaerolineales bacterium]